MTTFVIVFLQLTFSFFPSCNTGHYFLNTLRNYQMAERLFFECIYILDRTPSPSPGMAPIISELGSNALLQYAEVLLYNYKYKYVGVLKIHPPHFPLFLSPYVM